MKAKAAIIALSMLIGFAGAVSVCLAQGKLLRKTDLEYLGAFRVPQGDHGSPLYSGFNYGGTALAYNPKRNSLFLAGHAWYQLTAEISIPRIVKSARLEDLKTARVLQSFADVTEGHRSDIGKGRATVDTSGEPLGGLMVWNGKLLGTVFGYYDAANVVRLSHFTSGLDFSATGDFEGMYKVGKAPAVPNPAFIDGYMTEIPPEWTSKFGGPALTGNCCLSIISRTSLGPAASVFDPDDLGL
ncbi:MAG: hypothetical protein V2B18_22770, partial [Pseudomonadota bacterium]